jgi:hypothetical protein
MGSADWVQQALQSRNDQDSDTSDVITAKIEVVCGLLTCLFALVDFVSAVWEFSLPFLPRPAPDFLLWFLSMGK